ncbi:hypothetical protein BH24ACT6_BH24ACT6_08440 [soil metagenome]
MAVLASLATLLAAGCSDDEAADDGGTIRPLETAGESASGAGSGSASGSASASASGTASGSASGTASGSGSASASGTAASGTAPSGTAPSGTAASGSESATVDTSVTVDDPLVEEAAMQYTEYVRGQTDLIVSDAKVFTDAVRANDIDAAKAAYAPSRQAWERIEPIASLVEDIDVAVDARCDDFESDDDPAWTGWHKLEYLVYDVGDIGPESGATELADQLDADLATLQDTMTSTDIPAAAIPVGASELIEEVSGGKLTGEEDRYSGTDLWDIAANLDGSHAAFETLEGAVEAKDTELVERIEAGFEDADELIEKYEDGDGYQSFDELTEEDSDAFKTTLGSLADDLALVSGVLGLE